MEDTPEARAKYQEYLAWRKRQRAKKTSMANIAADEKRTKASLGGEGQEWEFATPFGKIGTGIKKSAGGDQFLAGVGSGLKSISDRAQNLVGLKSDKELEDKAALEEDLLSTGAGSGGRLLGQIAATAPVGTALGAVAKGATMLPGASRLASIAARTPMAVRVARTGGAALEGAGSGALMSDPGEGGTAAVMGGALSGGMNAAGQVGGKLLRAMRPQVTDAARRVMSETGEFIPVSQALPKESLLRQMYSGVVANLPGGQKLRGQAREAVDAAREKIFKEALPEGVPVNSVFQPGDDTYTAMKHAKKAWDSAFDDTNKAMVTGIAVPQDIADEILKHKPNAVIPRAGQRISGRAMKEFKDNVNDLAKMEKTNSLNRASKKRLWDLADQVDKRVYRDLLGKRNQYGEPLAQKYARNTKNWNNWLKVQSAAKKAEGGEFTPQQWESLIRKSNVREGIKDFADDAAKALPKFPSNAGPFQMVAATSLLGGAAGLGALSAGPDASPGERSLRALSGAAGLYGVGRGLSSKHLQKVLAQYGETGLLDKYPQLLRAMGGAVRRGAVAEQNDEE